MSQTEEIKLRITGDSSSAEAAMNRTRSGMNAMASQTSTFAAKIKTGWVGIGAAITGTFLAASKAWDMMSAAADYREQITYLNALGAAYGETGKTIVENVQKASDGLISMKDAAAIATEAMAKGLSTSQLYNLTKAAGVLGDTVNDKPAVALKNLTAALVEGKEKALKHYAGLIDLEAEYGDLSSRMTDAEKINARYNLVMEHTKGIQDELGTAAESTADKMDRFTVTLEDAKLKASEYALKGLFVLARAYYQVALAMEEVRKKYNESPLGNLNKKILRFGARARGLYGATGDYGETPVDNIARLKKQIADLDALIDADLSGTGAGRGLARYGDTISTKAGALTATTDQLAAAKLNWQQVMEALNPVLDEEAKALQRLADQAADLRQKWGDQAWIDDGLKKGREYLRQAREMKDAEQAFTEEIERRNEAARVSLDIAIRSIATEAQLADIRLSYERSALDLKSRYGEVSPGSAAASAYDMDVRRLEITRQQLQAEIDLRNSKALTGEEDTGILDLLMRQKVVEEEINQLLAIRSAALREHTGTMGEGFATGWSRYFDNIGSEFQRGEQYANDTASAMHRAFEDFFFDPMNYSWDNLWKDMQRVAARAMSDIASDMIRQLAKVAAQSASSGGGTIFGSLFGSLFGGGGNASMNWGSAWADTNFGGSFAAGGNVRPNKWYIVGEKGPEPFIPHTSGTVLPNAALGGSAPVINIINNNGSQVTANTRQTNRGMEIDVMIDTAVAGKLSTFGSASNKAMRRNYATTQRLTKR